MNRFLAVAVLLGTIGCSVTQPYVTNIPPAGEQGILVEKCKVQFNSITAKVLTEQCNTSYVWLGATSMEKGKLGEGTNPNNNVITIK